MARSREWLDYAGVEVLLAEGERDEALEKALEILAYERVARTEQRLDARRSGGFPRSSGLTRPAGPRRPSAPATYSNGRTREQALREPTLVPSPSPEEPARAET